MAPNPWGLGQEVPRLYPAARVLAPVSNRREPLLQAPGPEDNRVPRPWPATIPLAGAALRCARLSSVATRAARTSRSASSCPHPPAGMYENKKGEGGQQKPSRCPGRELALSPYLDVHGGCSVAGDDAFSVE
ncbi:hypothetical protein DL770_005397 [Monosporascus sp. CRB-9-2]|nr:hypothetical protein DL770_005397 [Monosporascus sp. CRB-9-2]